MKKAVIFLLSAVFMFTVFSCGTDKPVENFNDLKEKYTDKEFKNCDEFIVAYEEAMDIYFELIYKVDEGDEQAAKDMEELEVFVGDWDKYFDKFIEECPEKIEKLDESIDKKMDEYFATMFDDDFEDEWVDELTDEDLTESVEELIEE